jgi:hypothetical protein
MRGIDSEAVPKTSKGEKSILGKWEKEEIMILMSRIRCRSEGVNVFIASTTAGSHDTQLSGTSSSSSGIHTGARMVRLWRFGGMGDNSGKCSIRMSPVL